jgi:hypothetical protein
MKRSKMELREKGWQWDKDYKKLSYAGTKVAELIAVDTDVGVLYKVKFQDGTVSANIYNKTRAMEHARVVSQAEMPKGGFRKDKHLASVQKADLA